MPCTPRSIAVRNVAASRLSAIRLEAQELSKLSGDCFAYDEAASRFFVPGESVTRILQSRRGIQPIPVSLLSDAAKSRSADLRSPQDTAKVPKSFGRVSNMPEVSAFMLPTVIVPDTNCFMHQLPFVQKLLGSQLFVVAVPLMVLHELRGLSVAHLSALRAAAFVRSQFSSRCKRLRALSKIGILSKEASFIRENSLEVELGPNSNNDDVILNACVLLKKKVTDRKNVPILLLTHDMELKRKAIEARVPVSSCSAFEKTLQSYGRWQGYENKLAVAIQ